ncbi:metalloregulator ArsR/SmtB family transcription factor [Hyphomicrobium sp.]|uniref:ArsR/SmtB family transcription factor n=1 Tax=Hyphomicrobium sp. TaxID=82 RepID=UPI002E319E87|nr:metalloregulator ArsR/SmtB family transcription factor [Hyphomicrobium sp.]HEX2839856.1 metalloregulator ArsR/SmtB family transcription factor [Hyphomicrobium sp.]
MSAPQFDATFAALSDPTRRAILARLAKGEATVSELAAPFDLTQPAISKHLKVLERAGLISRGRAAQTRPCRLETAPLKQLARWIQEYQHLWEHSFDRLDTHLKAAQSSETKGKRHVRK